MKKKYAIALIAGLLVACAPLPAQEGLNVRLPSVFKAKQDYDVTYEVGSFQINTLHKVRVEGTVTLGGIQFLMVSREGSGNSSVNGFLKMTSVQSITPNGVMPAVKVFDQERK